MKGHVFWIFIFSIIFVSSVTLPHLSYFEGSSLFGLPLWLWAVIDIHILFVIALVYFSKRDDSKTGGK